MGAFNITQSFDLNVLLSYTTCVAYSTFSHPVKKSHIKWESFILTVVFESTCILHYEVMIPFIHTIQPNIAPRRHNSISSRRNSATATSQNSKLQPKMKPIARRKLTSIRGKGWPHPVFSRIFFVKL